MKKSIYFLSALLLIACSGADPSKVELYNGSYVQLLDSEKVYSYDQYAREMFSKITGSQSVSIPLFKYGRSASHEFFVGIPVEPNLSKFAQERSALGNSIAQDSTAVHSFGKYDGFFTSEVLMMNNGKSVYLLCSSKDSIFISTQFDFQQMKSRIHLSNEE